MNNKVLVLSNHPSWTYNLRKETIAALVKEGYDVTIVVGYGDEIEYFKEMGCSHIDVPFKRHGKNPFDELKLFFAYKKAITTNRPDVVLSYTIKPNLYGAILCHKYNIPCIANITGLGTAVEYPGLMRTVLLKAYRIAFKNIYKVFFQNTDNRDLFIEHRIVSDNYGLLPGSGVNLSRFEVLPYPNDSTIEFVFVSRIMKEKGIDEYLIAAETLKKKYPQTRFHICGFCEQNYMEIIQRLIAEDIVTYHGMVKNVEEILKKVHCLVLPTFYPEGMSNVLLESCACGRPIITTNRAGCREIVVDGVNGFIVRPQDSDDLIAKMEHFICLDNEQRKSMGLAGRDKVEKDFDRRIVVNKYLTAVEEAIKK